MTTKEEVQEWNKKNHPYHIVNLNEVEIFHKPEDSQEIILISKSQKIVNKKIYWFMFFLMILSLIIAFLSVISANSSDLPFKEFSLKIPRIIIEHKIEMDNKTAQLIADTVKKTINEVKNE